MTRTKPRHDGLLAIALLAAAGPAAAAAAPDYPNRPIRMLVGFSAGGGSDFAARIVGAKLTELLGQAVVIDNRTGANGAIAADMAAKAPPDGHTLAMLAVAQLVGSAFGNKLPYDLMRDFAPVSQATQQPYLAVVTPSLPVRTIEELIALGKAKPGQLNYASTGVGGSNHIVAELFCSMAGIRMGHVPYKGPPPALADVAGGQVQFMVSSIQTALPLVRANKLRALAVTSAKRAAVVPELPTVSQSVPGYEAIGWYGVLAPRATPRPIIDRLSAAIAQGMQAPDVRARIAADGSEAVGGTPEAFEKLMRAELARFSKVIREAGIKGE